MAKDEKVDAKVLEEETEEITEDTAEDSNDQQSIEDLLAAKESLANNYLDKLQRSMAEFDNFRKRTAKEKAAVYDDAVKDIAAKLLPVLDNFERALNTGKDDAPFYKGVEMVYRQLQEVIFGMGVSEITALGQKFDPNLHEAVFHVQDENAAENEVIEDMQKGYMYKDKVLRHSMVKVAN